MNSRRYRNGVKWLNSHDFTAQDDEPCYSWTKDRVEVYFDEDSSEWCASCGGWIGDYCATPMLALSALRRSFEKTRDSLLKQVQDCIEAIECLGNIASVA